jgi:hypothetical protein
MNKIKQSFAIVALLISLHSYGYMNLDDQVDLQDKYIDPNTDSMILVSESDIADLPNTVERRC